MAERLAEDFFQRDICDVAPDLIGKILVRKQSDGSEFRFRITEIEKYIGENDLACHASKGRTARTEVMYWSGGHIYVYLIYGMYWMLNVITGKENHPQGILIRGLQNCEGPGRVGRLLNLDKSFYGESLIQSDRIWIEDDGKKFTFTTHPRVNIDYAGEFWKKKAYRYILNQPC
jgi:DNA-3-methyladenine glycosylase